MKFVTAVLFLSQCFLVVFAEDAKCGAISIKTWSEHRSWRVEYLARPIDLVIIQHTVTPECNTDAGCRDIARSIQSYHVNDLRWADIGQSFLIGGNGAVYEGAGWLHVGAHTYGYNRKSIGISFIGNFSDKLPSSKALNATKSLLECGVRMGHLDRHYSLVGHKQVLATESPGATLYSQIQSWPQYLSDVTELKNM